MVTVQYWSSQPWYRYVKYHLSLHCDQGKQSQTYIDLLLISKSEYVFHQLGEASHFIHWVTAMQNKFVVI